MGQDLVGGKYARDIHPQDWIKLERLAGKDNLELRLEKPGVGEKSEFLGVARWPVDPFLGRRVGAASNSKLSRTTIVSQRQDDCDRTKVVQY